MWCPPPLPHRYALERKYLQTEAFAGARADVAPARVPSPLATPTPPLPSVATDAAPGLESTAEAGTTAHRPVTPQRLTVSGVSADADTIRRTGVTRVNRVLRAAALYNAPSVQQVSVVSPKRL